MRRVLPAALICLSLTLPALAQRGGHGGGGRAGGMRGGGFGHGGGFGGFHGGGFSHRPGFRTGFGFQRFPRIYPVFYGGLGYYGGYYGGFGYDDPYAYSPYASPYSGNSSDYGYAPATAPAVIVNQEFQTGPAPAAMLREYTAPAPSATVQRKYDEPLYLVAFNDGVIRAVLAYWLEGAALHYVTMEHAQKQVPLASIDRALSERLNGERNVTFQLPR